MKAAREVTDPEISAVLAARSIEPGWIPIRYPGNKRDRFQCAVRREAGQWQAYCEKQNKWRDLAWCEFRHGDKESFKKYVFTFKED